jgi:hypothetical protein
MIYLEPATNLNLPDADKIQPYNPEFRYDWTRFGRKLNLFLSEKTSLVQLRTPLSYINDRYFPDVLISDRLDSIANICTSNIPVRQFPSDQHPKNKNISTYWETFSYIEASKKFHGEDLSKLIEDAFLKKFCPPDQVDKVLARYHRMLWLPLYYPETIHYATHGIELNSLKEYKFYAPSSGCVSEFIRSLINQLKERSNVKIVSVPLKSLKFEAGSIKVLLSEGDTACEYAGKIYSGMSSDRFFYLTDPSICLIDSLKCTGVHICYVLIEKKLIINNFSTLNILDCSENALRISNMDSFATNSDEYARVTIEYPLDFSAPNGGKPPLDEVIRRDICKHIYLSESAEYQSIQILKKLTLNKALALPITENLNIYKDARFLMSKHFPGVQCFASTSYYGVASMNDQIIQGLSVGDEFYES